MHMHAAKHVSPTDDLQPFHEFVIPLLRTVDRLSPIRRGMSATSKDGQTVLGSCPRSHLPKLQQLVTCILSQYVGTGRNLELSLQHLPVKRRAGPRMSAVKQSFRRFRRRLQCSGVANEVFLLDTKLERRDLRHAISRS